MQIILGGHHGFSGREVTGRCCNSPCCWWAVLVNTRGWYSGYLPCPALSLSHAWLPELEVLVDSNEEFRAELSRFRGPFLSEETGTQPSPAWNCTNTAVRKESEAQIY